MSTLTTLFDSLRANTPCDLPLDWLQGRTAYGGFSAALGLKVAVDANQTENVTLRSAQISFIGPITADVIFTPEILRIGKSATYVGVKGVSDKSTVFQATYIFGKNRESAINHNFIATPYVMKPDQYSELPHKLIVPNFFKNFHVRVVSNSLFFSGGPKPELIAWVRFKDKLEIDDDISLLLIADSLPPASTVCSKEAAPISSMDWSFNIINSNICTEWLLLRSNSLVSKNGYSYQELINRFIDQKESEIHLLSYELKALRNLLEAQ